MNFSEDSLGITSPEVSSLVESVVASALSSVIDSQSEESVSVRWNLTLNLAGQKSCDPVVSNLIV